MNDSTIRVTMGRRVKEARAYLSLSQDELAGFVGISRSAISKIEDGSRSIEALELTKIAKALGRTTEYFTTSDIEPSKDEKVKLLARALDDLSDTDLGEVQRFADFLRTRSAG